MVLDRRVVRREQVLVVRAGLDLNRPELAVGAEIERGHRLVRGARPGRGVDLPDVERGALAAGVRREVDRPPREHDGLPLRDDVDDFRLLADEELVLHRE
jgi:hypothetical protein